MASGQWTFTDEWRTKLLQGGFAIGTDTFKIALFTSASNLAAGSTTYAGLTGEVSNANGYSTGGIATTLSLSGTQSVTVAFTQTQWNATSAGITAKWAVLYKVGGDIYAYALCDSGGADVTATAGNTFTVAAGNVISPFA